MSGFSVKLLTRPGCHLCDDARPLVEWAAAKADALLEEVDVESDDTLLGRYGLRIPVVLAPGDTILAEGRIAGRRRLLKAMRRAKRA